MSTLQDDTKNTLSYDNKTIIKTEIRKRLHLWFNNKIIYDDYINRLIDKLNALDGNIIIFTWCNNGDSEEAIQIFNKYNLTDKQYIMLQEFIKTYK